MSFSNPVHPSTSKAKTDFQELRETTNPPVTRAQTVPNQNVVSTANRVHHAHGSVVSSTHNFHDLPSTKQPQVTRVTPNLVRELPQIEHPPLNISPPVARTVYSLGSHVEPRVVYPTQPLYPTVRTSHHYTPSYLNPHPNPVRDEREQPVDDRRRSQVVLNPNPNSNPVRDDRRDPPRFSQNNKTFHELRDKTR